MDGIKPSMYGEFALKCLPLNYPTNIIETPMGNILLDANQKGKIYCGGLYVQDVGDDKCAYGYDIKPAHLELDRDRQKVSSWNLYWKTSEMYASIKNSEHTQFVYQLLLHDCPDIQYFSSFTSYRTDQMYKDICECTYTDFIEKYSVNAIPVKNEEDAKLIKDKYNHLVPIIIQEKEYIRIVNSTAYTDRISEENINTVITPSSILWDFFAKVKGELSESSIEELEHICWMSKNWK